MTGPEFEVLPVAIRVHTARVLDGEPCPPRQSRPRELPFRTIVFDCETTTDRTQRLLFGSWRLFFDDQHTTPGSRCVEEGLFFADDLPDRDPDGFDALRRYVRFARADTGAGSRSKLKLLSRSQFVDKVLWKHGVKNQATIVGYNLPFDLTRLATHVSPGRKPNRGGISLRLWEHDGRENQFRPRVVLQAIDGHRTLIKFTAANPGRSNDGRTTTGHVYQGRFLDLRTLAFAHTDDRSLSLETASKRFGVDYTKRHVTHSTITSDYIDYCREDVVATARLFQATHVEHHRHPVELAARSTFSPATLGKAYLADGVGITPFKDRAVWCDPQVAGWGMAAFYGGRTECRIRRVDVPVVYCDFRSMYQTCNVLMGTWNLITSTQLIPLDTTEQVRTLLARTDLGDVCFDPDTWTQMHTLVEVDPDGATLPVRARYDNQTWGIGVNPYQSTRTCWYPLADIIAATLQPGPNPIVHRAIRLTPGDRHPNLKTVRLFGEVDFNPHTDDFFAACVEQRQLTRTRTDLPADTCKRLGPFFKVLANATGFGIFGQYDRTHTTDPVPVNVHTDNGTFTRTTDTPRRCSSVHRATTRRVHHRSSTTDAHPPRTLRHK